MEINQKFREGGETGSKDGKSARTHEHVRRKVWSSQNSLPIFGPGGPEIGAEGAVLENFG